MRKCPKCDKKINEMMETCPFCGELLFQDIIEIEEVEDEYVEETLEDIISEENIIIRSIVKGIVASAKFVKKSVSRLSEISYKAWLEFKYRAGSFDFVKIGASVKKLFVVKLPNLIYRGLDKFGVINLLKKITYERGIGIAIIISTICLLFVCIKDFIYLDKISEVARVTKKTTTADVRKLYDVEPQVKLDITDGTIAYIYDKQKFAEIEDCTIFYKVNPDNNKVAYIRVEFPSKVMNIVKMRSYLEVNYGDTTGNRLKEIWNYKKDDISYMFTNGVYDTEIEYVLFTYLKNEPSMEEIRSGISNSLNRDDSKEDVKEDKTDKKDNEKKDSKSEKKDSDKKKNKEKDKEEKKKDKKEEKEEDNKQDIKDKKEEKSNKESAQKKETKKKK